jgi:hypothetical protein
MRTDKLAGNRATIGISAMLSWIKTDSFTTA